MPPYLHDADKKDGLGSTLASGVGSGRPPHVKSFLPVDLAVALATTVPFFTTGAVDLAAGEENRENPDFLTGAGGAGADLTGAPPIGGNNVKVDRGFSTGTDLNGNPNDDGGGNSENAAVETIKVTRAKINFIICRIKLLFNGSIEC